MIVKERINFSKILPRRIENISTLKGGELGFVAVYFNPCGFKTPRQNFERFLKRFEWLGSRLLIVELAFHEKPFVLTGKAENLLQLRSDSVMWQKEAMINAGTKVLRERGVENVGWLDGDTIIEGCGEEWLWKVAKGLKRQMALQVFEEVEHRFADRDITAPGSMANWAMRKTPVNKIWKTGLGWAVRGEIWDQCGWYDLGIIGSGDRLLFLATVLDNPRQEVEDSPQFKGAKGYLKSYLSWAQRWGRLVKRQADFAAGVRASSEEHGSHDNRQYYAREIALRNAGYDPYEHLSRDHNGLLEWAKNAPNELKTNVYDYFKNRKEDE